MPEELSEFNKSLKTAMGMREKTPRISVNKLAEYMIADPLRRRQIVKDQKNQEPVRTSPYSDARRFIKEFIGQHYNEGMLLSAIDTMEQKEVTGKWQITNQKNSLLALNHVIETHLPDLEEYDITYNKENNLIRLSGLDISVYPDVLLSHKNTGKKGGLKIHLSKDNELLDPAMGYVGTLVKYHFIQMGMDEKEIDDNACISLDVFRRAYGVSPKAYKRTIGKVEAACEEICLRWERI